MENENVNDVKIDNSMLRRALHCFLAGTLIIMFKPMLKGLFIVFDVGTTSPGIFAEGPSLTAPIISIINWGIVVVGGFWILYAAVLYLSAMMGAPSHKNTDVIQADIKGIDTKKTYDVMKDIIK